MSEKNLACAVCQKISSLKCGRCQRIAYCSKEHQRLDWKVHKKNCELVASKCYEIAEDPKLGRYVVSTRCILQGEVVLKEAPLLTGPMDSTPPVCLGCYKLLNQFNSHNCSRCNWPLCSLDCENSTAHKPECEITTKFKKEKVTITKFDGDHPSYRCLTVLRALYQKTLNRVTWEKVSKLESHCEERKSSERYKDDVLLVAQFIPRFFNYHEFTQEEILKMTGIIQVNAHLLPLQEPGFIAIYDVASMIEHSCLANCSKSFSEDGKIVIRAARPIQKGEHLSISYTQALWGRQARQDHLFLTKYFICECVRCCDPTELGTHFNSLKCANPDCNGYIVPHLSEVRLEYRWICMECKRGYESDLMDLFRDVNTGISNLDKNSPESCKEFLMKYKKYLPPNHYFMVEVKLALIGYYGEIEVCGTSDEDLNLIIDICKNLLDLSKKLVPAENRLRGILYFRLYSALSELVRRKSLSEEMDDTHLKQNLVMCRDILKKGYSFLKYEPESCEEGKMAIKVMKYIHDINKLMGGNVQ